MAIKVEIIHSNLELENNKKRKIGFAVIYSEGELSSENSDLIPRGIKFDGRQEKGAEITFDSPNDVPTTFKFNTNREVDEENEEELVEIDIDRREVWLKKGGVVEFQKPPQYVHMRVSFADNNEAFMLGRGLHK